MIIHKISNEHTWNCMAADMICAQIIEKPDSVLGFATGSTPLGLYAELVKRYEDKQIDFAEIRSFNLDEYCGLSRDHEQSYYSFMMQNLFSKVNMKQENIHIPSGTNNDINAECIQYEQKIDALGGIDLQILGIGFNGHIGFNEPNSVFIDKTHCETLKQETRQANQRFFDKIEDVPSQAISMGIGTIMRAKKILLLGSKGKQEIIETMIKGEIDPSCPASILKLHPNVTILYR